MKQSHITGITVGSLLAAAALCLGLRHGADRRRAEESRTHLRNHDQTTRAATADAGRSGQAGSRTKPAATGGQDDDRKDARDRLRLLLSTGTGMDRTRGFLQMIAGLKSEDFPLLLADLTAVGLQHDDRSQMALAAWAEIDPAAAVAWAASEPAAGRIWQVGAVEARGDSTAYRGETIVLRTWLANDAAAAMDWVTSRDTDKKSHELQLWALGEWTRQDGPAALAWAQRLSQDAPGSDGRLKKVLGVLMMTDLPRVIEVISHAPQDARAGLITAIGAGAGKLPAAARDQWLAALSDPGLKEAAVAAIISGRNGASADDKLDLLEKYPGAAGMPGTAEIYRDWIKKEPDAALQSLNTLEAGDLRDQAVRVAIDALSWGERCSAEKGLELMNRYPEAVDEITLMTWFTTTVNNAHAWELGLSQIPRVQNDQAQEQFYQEVLRSWLWIDRDSARKWIDNHELPETVKKAMATK
ncbi:MAG: hypothetical protein JWO82_4264 [Akkermansiaceae bacterium]|nr:hypothetical protein [Akkermansiaceae bacterium]